MRSDRWLLLRLGVLQRSALQQYGTGNKLTTVTHSVGSFKLALVECRAAPGQMQARSAKVWRFSVCTTHCTLYSVLAHLSLRLHYD